MKRPVSGWMGDAVRPVTLEDHVTTEPFSVFTSSKRNLKATSQPGSRPASTTPSEVDHEEGPGERGVLGQIMLGSSPAVTRALAAHPATSPFWGPAHWLDAVLRASGAPCFLNNPFSGALILTAMAVDETSGPEGAGATLLGASCALLAALALLGERGAGLSSGGLTFNGALIGVTLGSGAALHHRPWLLGPIIILSAMSAWLSRGLAAVLARLEVPALNVAFNVLVALWMTVEASWAPSPQFPAAANPANASTVDWAQVVTGVLMAPGQVFACSSITSCCLVYLSFLVFSPMLFLSSLLGASVGTLLGVALCPSTELTDLYTGKWGVCSLLTATALGGIFFVFNTQSVLVSLVGAALACLCYGALQRALQPLGVPVLAWPFVLSTWLLVGNPRSRFNLLPVPLAEVTTPEEARHREQQRQLQRSFMH